MLLRLRQFLFGSLSRRLTSGMMIFYIVVIGVFITDLTLRQRSLLLNQKITQAEALSRSVAVSVEDWLLSKDYGGLQDIVDAQEYYPELVFAMILDADEMVVAHTDRQYLGRYVTDMPDKASTTVIYNTSSLIDVASPVTINGKNIGWVRVGIDRNMVTARLDDITRGAVLYGIAAILVASFLAYFMGNYITRRIRVIQSVADAVQAGDMGRRAYLKGNDEAAMLARQFNSMLDRILESESKFHAVAVSAQDAIIILDNDGLITFWNNAAEKVFGYMSSDVIGKDMHVLLAPKQYHESYIQGYSVFKTTGMGAVVGKTLEIKAVKKDGTEFPIEISVSAVKLKDKWNAIGIARDITERKQAEERIKQFNEELEERISQRTAQLEAANKEMESFTYSVSHDLRAPLRAIDGFSEVILEEYGDRLGDEGMAYLQRVRAASQKMGTLIDDILSLPRLTMGEIHKSQINLSDMASDIIRMLRELAPQRDVEVVIAEGMTDKADANLMDMVLTHLLSNAWKFTSKKDKGKIEFNSIEKDGNRVYYIKDNGVGFDMNYVNKLFLPFQRLHSREEFPGMGIGLATVYRVIKKHGGNVWTQSEVGKGATFYFTLKGG